MRAVVIEELSQESMQLCRYRIDRLTKPVHSLAHLELMAERLAGIYAEARPQHIRKGLVLFTGKQYGCHGAAEKEAADVIIPEERYKTTYALADELAATVYVGEIIAEDAEAAFDEGVVLAERMYKDGITGVGIGHFGSQRRGAVQRIVALQGKEAPLAEVLAAIRCPVVAGMIGFVLAACALRMAVVFDDNVTLAAVLGAATVSSRVKEYVFASLVYDDPIHQEMLALLGRKAFLHYGMMADGGVGAALGLSLLDASLHMLNDMKTFAEAEVTVAEDGPGATLQKG